MCYCRACAAWLATLAVQYIIEGCERRGQVGKLGVSDTLMMVQKLVAEGKVRISEHGYDELADDNIFTIEVLDGTRAAETAMIRKAKFIHEGRYAAEIPVELIEDDSGWSPYLSVDDPRSSTLFATRCVPATSLPPADTDACSNWCRSRSDAKTHAGEIKPCRKRRFRFRDEGPCNAAFR
jgi:hypothetical protein